ncbi:PHP domain-containing protein [Candidatus Chloroploca sp. M-50]|uniref:PHP domain-containing protein n=1 Tax=Candidatus Chloroploca mongolica TaxID=2528176 RepID=A0ABS4D5H7_9CHLR|nr:PHP domain-containing protein [Candidatus Chloroploca mongolica]MBP1464685.1 PHP domain-containing protein [Candidatus Chloroploca mongolica]
MIDLHIHTTATPHHATWTPDALAATAVARGLTVIAATDHNTTAGVAPLMAAGQRHGVRVIPGVELDSADGGKLWHTLVYGVDPEAPALVALCAAVFERNLADAERLRRELPAEGFRLEGLEELGRAPNVAEVATALARGNSLPGRVAGEDDEAAGMRFLLQERPGSYQPLRVAEIIDVAHTLRGLVVLAHPGRSKGVYAIPADEADIAALVEAGLDGLEVYYPTHTPAQEQFYRTLAAKYGLLVSGGSDSHHPSQALAALDPALVTLLEGNGLAGGSTCP